MNKMMPEYTRRNATVNEFVIRIQKLFVWGIESQLTIRNFYNPVVSRYYNRHNN